MSNLSSILNGSLKRKLIELIRIRGALSVADYMKIVLTNPEDGFYMKDDVFGVKGHFTTSPEISQMFGELMGAWILQEWHRFGNPLPLRLVEFGPGRGTLISDIVRTLRRFNKTDPSPQVNLIEVSSHLKKIQADKLREIANIKWYTHLEEMDNDREGFTAFIAHEFLDALPIHKFVRDPQSKQWRELLVDYDKHDNLIFCLAKQPSLASRLLVPQDFGGDHIEVCPEAAITVENVVKKLNNTGSGCMLICDYGFHDVPEHQTTNESSSKSLKFLRSERDTLRAFKNHDSWPPLSDPGNADLTADVDFGYIKKHINKHATVFGPVCQRDFLLRCGLELRLESLLKGTRSEEEKEVLISEADMLVNDMGQRYKFMALFPKDSQPLFKEDPPAGFDISPFSTA